MKGITMEKVTTEELCDFLEVMTNTRSVDHGFAIVHFGHIGGMPTIAISTCSGGSYIIQ